MSLFDGTNTDVDRIALGSMYARGEAFTVYPIVLVKTSDEKVAPRKPRVYPYKDAEVRWEAARTFLEGGSTIRFEDEYETDGSEFDGKFGER